MLQICTSPSQIFALAATRRSSETIVLSLPLDGVVLESADAVLFLGPANTPTDTPKAI